jgi:hypothetical protein
LACAFAKVIAKTVEMAEARAAFLITSPRSEWRRSPFCPDSKVQVVVQLKSFAIGSQLPRFELPDLFDLAAATSTFHSGRGSAAIPDQDLMQSDCLASFLLLFPGFKRACCDDTFFVVEPRVPLPAPNWVAPTTLVRSLIN